MPDKSTRRLAVNLANAILQHAENRNGCHGRYCLIIRGGPNVPRPSSTEGIQTIEAAARFIDLTGTSRSHDEELLLTNESGTIGIEKQERLCGSKVVVDFRAAKA